MEPADSFFICGENEILLRAYNRRSAIYMVEPDSVKISLDKLAVSGGCLFIHRALDTSKKKAEKADCGYGKTKRGGYDCLCYKNACYAVNDRGVSTKNCDAGSDVKRI